MVATVLFVTLAALVHWRWPPLRTLDLRTAHHLNRYLRRHPDQVRAWRAVSMLGAPVVFRLVAAAGAVALGLRHRIRLACFVVVSVLGAAVLSGTLKALVRRPRPVFAVPLGHAGGASFPSGHALTSFVFTGMVVVIAWPRLSRRARLVVVAIGALVVALVGASRVALGVHYVSDVLGAWLIGLAWLGAAAAALRVTGTPTVAPAAARNRSSTRPDIARRTWPPPSP